MGPLFLDDPPRQRRDLAPKNAPKKGVVHSSRKRIMEEEDDEEEDDGYISEHDEGGATLLRATAVSAPNCSVIAASDVRVLDEFAIVDDDFARPQSLCRVLPTKRRSHFTAAPSIAEILGRAWLDSFSTEMALPLFHEE